MTDAWTLLQRRRRASAGSPVLTFVDLAHGERTELSAASLENAAAKIANALREEFELEPGAVLGLHVPQHWQRAAWCAGAWTAGCVVSPGGSGPEVDLVVATAAGAAELVDLGRARPVVVVSMHPFGLPLTHELPPGCIDATLAVRQQPDAYLFAPPDPGNEALRVDGRRLTQQEAFDSAADLAREWGLVAGGRLLVDAGLDDAEAWLGALAVPLVAEASVLLVGGGHAGPTLIERERVTATARRRP